jgi:TonB family protein
MRRWAARTLINAACSISVAAQADELKCTGVVETIVSEHGSTVAREVCHDSDGVTIPYDDFPLDVHVPDSAQRAPASVTEFKAQTITLQCCCPPGGRPVGWVEPEYPAAARQSGIVGWVTVSGGVAPDGRIREARVTASSPENVFDNAALNAFSQWTFNKDDAETDQDGRIVPGLTGIARICFPSPFLTVPPDHAAVVAFVQPPLDRRAEEFIAAVDHLRSALDMTAACLGIAISRAQLLEAGSVTIPFGGRDFTYLTSAASGVGAVLLATDKPPVEVASPAGASALQILLPEAAAAYFNAPACGQREADEAGRKPPATD